MSIAADLWVKEYRKRPVITSIVSFIVFTSFVTVVIISEHKKRELADLKRSENLTYHNQLEALNTVEMSMKNLVEFVQTEKKRLKEAEDVLAKLEQERNTLIPVVEADRKIVQAIFQLQAQMNREGVWKNRIIAFVSGVLASIIASFFYGVVKHLRIKEDNIPISSE